MVSSERQAGAEIEVTPEMVEAGVTELLDTSLETDFPWDAVKRIYRAMHREALSRHPLEAELKKLDAV